MEHVNINQLEDDSVSKKIEETARKLQQKYNKRRKVNEKVLKPKTPFQKFVSVAMTIVCSVLVVFSLAFCMSNINSKLQGVVPTFAGYGTMRVVSGSMVASGIEIGDVVVTKSADTNTLKSGDIIVFYTYSKSYYGVSSKYMTCITDTVTGKSSSGMTLLKFFGVQNQNMQEAAKAGASLTIHMIRDVFEDSNGTRWFSTYGTSNASDDTWLIAEDYVVGIYDNSAAGRFISMFLGVAASGVGIYLLVLIPFLLIAFLLVKQSIRDVHIARLELDIVEEKRKLTDEICVANEVGFGMDNKTKYKVLAQAEPEEINKYLSLLWKNGSAPNNVRKYYLRKQYLLSGTVKLRDLNRECEKQFANGVQPNKIARFYNTEKEKIRLEDEAHKREIKAIRKKYKSDKED